MKRVLITLRPMEPYFLGDEKIFSFSPQTDVKAPYFIRSLPEPSQSTLLGIMRYVILEQTGLLRQDFTYSKAETEEISKYIGKSSFSIGGASSFGKLLGIGPLFLMDSEGKYYIHTPMDHRMGMTQYMSMLPLQSGGAGTVLASFPRIAIDPDPDVFHAKDGLHNGFLCVDDLRIVSRSDVFTEEVRVGIRKKTRSSETLSDGFFKRVYVNLNKRYAWCFAFHVLVGDDLELPRRTLVHMGQKRSMFQMECGAAEQTCDTAAGQPLIDKVLANVRGSKGREAYLALSDCYCKTPLSTICDCALTRTRTLRSLRTAYQPTGGGFYSKLSRTEDAFRVFQAGSVFYLTANKEAGRAFLSNFFEETACMCVGMNQLVSIGG